MAKPPKLDDPQAQAEALSIPERILLIFVARKTEWERAGITGATVTAMVVKGLVERDTAGELSLTKQGRAVLAALLVASVTQVWDWRERPGPADGVPGQSGTTPFERSFRRIWVSCLGRSC
jgi:hypothetical protein